MSEFEKILMDRSLNKDNPASYGTIKMQTKSNQCYLFTIFITKYKKH